MVEVCIVYGPPCSGKTTYIQEHKGDNDLLYDFDDIMTSLSGFDSHSINRNLIDYVVDIRNIIIDRLKNDTELEKAFFITTFIKEDLEERLEGLDIEYIKMDTPKEVCLERLEKCPLRKRKSALRKVIEEWFEEYGDEEVRTKLEKRHMHFNSDLKVRNDEGDGAFIEGYFAVFNQETELWPGAFEEIAVGAFDKSLNANEIFCLDNHDTKSVLGDTVTKTLSLKSDNHGLWGRVELDLDDPVAKSAYQKVKTGKVRGCSFGFFPAVEETEHREDGTIKWRVIEADTKEVSITAFPAYAQTDIRSREKQFEKYEKRKLEQKKIELRERLKK